MNKKLLKKLNPIPIKNVKIKEGFWGAKQDINRSVTLPIEYKQLKDTGRIDAWKLNWRPGQPNKPHQFWDSDVAKWIEAAAYSLAVNPDGELEKRVDEVVDMIANAQHDDGYLNIYYSVVEPGKRWTNLRDMHELYCAGHMIEAAAAYYEATGKKKLLDVMCRYADHIDTVFGPEEGKKKGYPGHPEIELALVKLYRVTGEERYLKLSKYFIDERGRDPKYFDAEAKERGEEPGKKYWWDDWEIERYAYYQAHRPVREQDTAEGHAVRAMYLFSGMADVAAETGDDTLMEACKKLWKNVVEKRMYITGGVGSNPNGERFTFDYDLPNETAYAETCAAIGLVFWAQRMLNQEGDSVYADIMEKALYNGVLSGVSLDGTKFFYANPLQVYPPAYKYNTLGVGKNFTPTRQEWFGCACCPPNVARIISSLGQYIYSQSQDQMQNELYVNLYIQSTADFQIKSGRVALKQKTLYPWDGKVEITILPEKIDEFILSLRIPGWCRKANVNINGNQVENIGNLKEKGYLKIKRQWKPEDLIELYFDMPVEKIEAHPSVRMNCGRIALQRGPIVYCFEEADNGADLADIMLPYGLDAQLKAEYIPELLNGIVVIRGKALRRNKVVWEGKLYQPELSDVTDAEEVDFMAVPYHAWCNRKPGEMVVWIPHMAVSPWKCTNLRL